MNGSTWIPLNLLLMLSTLTETSAKTVDVFWNKTSSQFSMSSGVLTLQLSLADRIEFRCPYYTGNELISQEYYKIYRVPRAYYESCYIPQGMSDSQLSSLHIHRVTSCIKPEEPQIYSVVLTQFSALPGSHGGLEFLPGQMYYFISTSDGSMSGIDNRSSEGSACKMHNMKMKLNISAPAGYQKSTRWQYTTRRPSEAGTRAGSLTHPTTLTDLSSKTTTDYARPKFPQAVINAEIKMYSSSSTPPCSPLMFVLSLLCCLLCRHHIP